MKQIRAVCPVAGRCYGTAHSHEPTCLQKATRRASISAWATEGWPPRFPTYTSSAASGANSFTAACTAPIQSLPASGRLSLSPFALTYSKLRDQGKEYKQTSHIRTCLAWIGGKAYLRPQIVIHYHLSLPEKTHCLQLHIACELWLNSVPTCLT